MKRKSLFIAALIMGAMAVTGCSSQSNETEAVVEDVKENVASEAVQEDVQEDAKEEIQEEAKEFEGTLETIKDFMFVVTDASGVSYSFPYEGEKPSGLSEATEGDQVKVTFIGEPSEVDAFECEIISVEKLS